MAPPKHRGRCAVDGAIRRSGASGRPGWNDTACTTDSKASSHGTLQTVTTGVKLQPCANERGVEYTNSKHRGLAHVTDLLEAPPAPEH